MSAAELPRTVGSMHGLVALANEDENSGMDCNVRGVVTHVNAIRPRLFVLAPPDKPYRNGVPVSLPDGATLPEEGDEVWVNGVTRRMAGRMGVAATGVAKVGTVPLDFTQSPRYVELRKGLFDYRRVTLDGVVHGVSREDGGFSVVRLALGERVVPVRVPGTLDEEDCEGRLVRVTGCVFPILDESGAALSRQVEISKAADMVFLVHDYSRILFWSIAIFFIVAFIVAFGAFIRSRRERLKLSVVMAERKRMASDLHDTIEQHLASARLVLAGVAADKSLSAYSRELIEHAGDILLRAKTETRDAVLNLRSDEALEKSPAAALKEMAASLVKSGGVDVRVNLRGLPETLPQGRYQDMLAITREAVTNAIKHGKAKRIVIVSDPRARDEGRGMRDEDFVLRILNDGDIFDPAKVLGPSTGHFGLAGMRERAARSGFAFAITREKFGMCVTLTA